MKKYIYCLVITIIVISSLISCSNEKQNNIKFENNKLENITDREILNFLEEVKNLEKSIYYSFNIEKSKIVKLSDKEIIAYKTKSPYETPKERESAYKKYYLDLPIVYSISEGMGYSSDYDFTNEIVEKDDEFYFIPSQENIFTYNYEDVISKEIIKDTLRTEIRIEDNGEEYNKIIYFVMDNGKLKIDNRIKNEIKSSLDNVTDEEILEIINQSRKLYKRIVTSFNTSDSIEHNYLKFYKTESPYETIEKRSEAMNEYFIDENQLNKIYNEDLGSNAFNTLYKKGDDYYFNPIQLGLESIATYNEIVSKEIIDNKLNVRVRVMILDSYSYKDYTFVEDEGKIKVLDTKFVNEDENKYTIIKNEVENKISNIFTGVKGNYSVVFKDLNENDSLSINNSKMPSASTIKIYVMIEAYNQVNQGKISLRDTVTLNDSMIVGGSGVLQYEPVGTEVTIEELINLMMVESDNVAANILIDKLGMTNINTTIKSLGCVDTELNRKMMDIEALNKGIENYTSVNDLSLVLEKLYKNQCIESQYDKLMLDTMKQHQLKSKIPNELPEGVVVAHKSGELGGIENDAGIIYTDKGAYVLCILTNNGTSSEQVMAISDVSREIYDKYMEYKGQ